MADEYGGLEIPVAISATSPEATGDPALEVMSNYIAAFLNKYASTAWQSICPRLVSEGESPIPVVKTVFVHNPEEYVFNEKNLPALYIWRQKGNVTTYMAEEYRVFHDVWTALWIFLPAVQQTQRARDNFTNAIAKVVDRAIEQVRDPVYVAPGDTDSEAADVAADPTAIKTSIASSTSIETYAGAALDGAIGSTSFSPGQQPTVTIGGDPSSIIPGTQVVFTGLGKDGGVRSSVVTLDAVAGTYVGTWHLTQVTQIDVDAQAGIDATLSFGLYAVNGKGSVSLRVAGIQEMRLTSWRDRMVGIELSGAGKIVRTYDAIEMSFEVIERFTTDIEKPFDPDAADNFSPSAIYQEIAREDGSVFGAFIA